MSWTVVYQPTAEEDLEAILRSAPDPQEVAQAADSIDRTLAADPLDAGESRGDLGRICIVPPLAVLYDVDEGNRRSMVWAVLPWRKRQRDGREGET